MLQSCLQSTRLWQNIVTSSLLLSLLDILNNQNQCKLHSSLISKRSNILAQRWDGVQASSLRSWPMSGFKPNFQQTEFVNADLTIQRRWFASKWMSFVSDTPLTRTNSSRNRQLIGMTTDMRLLLLHTFYLIFKMSNYQPILSDLCLRLISF